MAVLVLAKMAAANASDCPQQMTKSVSGSTWGGAGKSGKPSARLTAPTRCARWDSCWMGDGADRLDAADSLRSMASPRARALRLGSVVGVRIR